MATSLRAPDAGGTSLPYRRLSLVLNDKAGALLALGDTPDLAARLASGGATTRAIPAGALPERLREAARDTDAVIVAGGDGTVACAAKALAGTGLPLGVLPFGTMNLLAKDLRLPVGAPNDAADIVLAGHTRTVDVGAVADETFLCACMLGVPARMGRYREAARERGAWKQWLPIARAAIRVLLRPRSRRFSIMVDGVSHLVRTPSVTITLNALDDAHGRLFGRSCLDGGMLFAYVVRRPTFTALARAFFRMALGRPRDASLQVLSGRKIVVNARAAALHVLVDGEERLLSTPVRFTVRQGALRVFAPKAAP